ncbi:MAG: PilZ domain-containing protein [Candidatus Zixiibacteriota bacterium]
MDERRKHIRKATSDYFLIYDRDTDKLVGRVLNLSPAGTMVISDSPVAVSKVIKCKMVMPRKISTRHYISFDAECRWCLENKRWKWYEIGCQLSNISEEDQSIIRQLIGEWVIKEDNQPLTITVSE